MMLAERRTGWSAVELLAETFPEPRWAVPGILPEGLNLLAGAPKIGKSWLAGNIGIAVASGGSALGKIPVEQGPVLWLALEDSGRRLQSRLGVLLNGEPPPENLQIETKWPPLDVGGAEDIAAWIHANPGCRLVIIDVLAKLRDVSDRSDRYLSDYAAMEPFKRVADDAGCSLLLLHHTRKAEATDYVDAISGTNGIAGACDQTLVVKRARGQADAELGVTGRDVEDRNLALKFDKGAWTLLGDAAEWALSSTRKAILDLLKDREPMKPKDVAEALDQPRDAIRQALSRMARDGQLTNTNGLYTPVTPVTESQIAEVLPLTKSDSVTPVTPLPYELLEGDDD